MVEEPARKVEHALGKLLATVRGSGLERLIQSLRGGPEDPLGEGPDSHSGRMRLRCMARAESTAGLRREVDPRLRAIAFEGRRGLSARRALPECRDEAEEAQEV